MNSGYLGSFIIHGVLVAIGLTAASLAVIDVPHETAGAETTLSLDPGPSPGEPGASGGPTSATPSRPVAWTPVKVLDTKRLLEEFRANQVATPPPPPVSTVSASPVRPVKPTSPPTRTTPTVPTSGDRAPGPRRPLVAPTVDGGATSAPGVGGGSDPNRSTSPGGVPGSGVPSKFVSSLVAEFARTFLPLFREQGADLGSEKDSGVVKLRVSPSGNVTFAGWITRPSEPVMEEIVRRAVERMHPVLPPPDGEEIIVRIPVSGTVE